MTTPLYFDYAATTPVDERVADRMAACLTRQGNFANPASQHELGQAAHLAVETAREQVASLIHADPREIIWTSGATESDNLAIKGAAQLYQRRGKHIVTMQTEHKAVLDTCQHLEKHGFTVTYLKPERDGLLSLEKLIDALRDDTVLVSVMHVNNETGVVQDIKAIAAETSKRNILLHVDAAQSTGKVEIDVTTMPIDLMSMCAHKTYGPKGIGALYVRRKPRVRVEPLIHGGGHEQGMRSGTLATHQMVGMGESFAIAKLEMQQDREYVLRLRDYFLKHLQQMTKVSVSVPLENTVPHILNVCFDGFLADPIMASMPHVAVSTASACQGKAGVEGSHVLKALAMTDEETKSAIRFSFGRMTTQEEVDEVLTCIRAYFAKSLAQSA